MLVLVAMNRSMKPCCADVEFFLVGAGETRQ
jgi:hypothetical protein